MKEIHDIIAAYHKAQTKEKSTALATVVKVDGSSYRRPGARMLVTEDGELTGAISGGCLEGDALRKAQTVMFKQQSMVVTYDTTDEDDQKFGVGLGCNGIIQVLIEPILPMDPENPIALLEMAMEKRQNSALVTVFSLKNSREKQIGTTALFKGDEVFGGLQFQQPELFKKIQFEIQEIKENNQNMIASYSQFDDVFVFYEHLHPPVQVLLFGAGNDTIPLVNIAAILGWEVIVMDGRKNYATPERFPKAKEIISAKAEDLPGQIKPDANTVALLMSHNFEFEATVLESLIPLSLPYIGILGPKKKTIKLKERLSGKGVDMGSLPDGNIFAPTGLDIGSESPEEIALAVVAEIQAVMKGKKPSFLREKEGPIHEEEIKTIQSKNVP